MPTHGRAVFEFKPAEYHMNQIGSVHGADDVARLGDELRRPHDASAGVAHTTLEVKTNFARAITLGTGRMVCTGTVVHGGSRVATAEGRLEDEGGKLHAHRTTTCLVFR